ncbi:phospholipid methyltransferase [Metarhizium album ARSEF 1941]|uniref:Phospholipid methyltransferase n=1 Tax=Metarhizium album (strain ARSEF 1941) TaxID=1081103 RepID=A0A0B2WUH5_METAS|nr:phospholipid methyltransferase [Metarhizium album ARSEF 1941]KHN96600.1 phospholipid methyltransferase [Metarhizium album ARSEF 1941]
MSLVAHIQQLFEYLVEPWLIIASSISHIPSTISGLVSSGDYGKLLSPSAFGRELFGNLWVTLGPETKANAEPVIVPLLEGKVSGAKVHDHVVSTPVHGTVLEVGAGSGMWADVLARVRENASFGTGEMGGLRSRRAESGTGAGRGGITKIYGIEPNPISAAALRKRVREVGLGDVYEVVPVGVEDVTSSTAWEGTIEPGSVDCIVGIRCMCSIPDPRENIERLYKLLKPGGTWYVFEHVKTTRGFPIMPLYQRFVNCVWMFFMGPCRICRPTDQTLRDVGTWSKFDLATSPDEPPYAVMPHVIGVLTK